MSFAAVLAIVFKPLSGILQRKVQESFAAGLIVVGLIALMLVVFVATVRGVTEQADQIGSVTDPALEKAAEHLDAAGVDQAALDDARAATEECAPMIARASSPRWSTASEA